MNNSAASVATSNAAAINLALTNNRFVTFSGSGIVWVNTTLLVPSNTELNIPKGVEIKLADGSNTALLANKNAFNLGLAIGSAVNWVGNQPDYSATIVKTGIGNTYPVDSWIGAGSSRRVRHRLRRR